MTSGSSPRSVGTRAGSQPGRERDYHALVDLVDHAEDVSCRGRTESEGRTVLVHSDFNPKNILVDPETVEVVGVVDWEFAHAGSLYADFGNLTPVRARATTAAGAVLETLRRRGSWAARCRRRAARRTCGRWSSWPDGCRAEPGPRAGHASCCWPRRGPAICTPGRGTTPRVDPKQAKRVL